MDIRGHHFSVKSLTPFLLLLLVAVIALFAPTQPNFADPEGKYNAADIAWVLVATALVFLMTPGLAFFLWRDGTQEKCALYHDKKFCSNRDRKYFMGNGWL